MLLPGNGFALDPARDLLHYNCQTWSRQNGLPANGINAITQTKDGYLWLGTSGGLVRFDGLEFKLLDLGRVPRAHSSTVTSAAAAMKGGLWVGLGNSSFGFCDGQSFSFLGREAWGTESLNVRTILENKDGTVCLAAESMVARLSLPDKFEELVGSSIQLNPDFLCGYEDSERRLWFGSAANGLNYWQAGKITKLPDPVLDTFGVYCVAEDNERRIWVGTATGLYCYDSNLRRKEIPPLTSAIRALLVDRHGVLWIGTSANGLANYQNGVYSVLRKSDGLASDYINALAEDREGSLWIGTRDGLSQLTDVKFTTQPAAADPTIKDAMSVSSSRKGGIWTGSSAGLTYFDGKFKTYGAEAGLTNTWTKRVFEAADGDVYLVSGNRILTIFSGEKAVARHSAPNMVVGMAEDAQGVVVSVGGDLYRAGRNYFTPYVFTNGAPMMGWVLNLTGGRDGEIWVSSVNGLFRVKDGGYQQWGTAEGLTEPAVQWVCEDDDGVIWGASLNGIIRLKNNRIRTISRKDGLFDNDIYSIMSDNFGRLWVDSKRGIFTVSRKNISDFADGKASQVECVAYDGPESVKPSDKTAEQEHVACKTTDGRMWFPTPNGVVMIDPAHIRTNLVAPLVQIDSILVNGVEVGRSNKLVVPPGQAGLEIRFSALSFIAPRSFALRYRLEGYDKEWVQIRDRRVAFYTNLKPGRYTFRVIAANSDGVWNETGDSLDMELRPHFYQTVWFDVLCGGLACSALLGIYLRRVRRFQQKQRSLQEDRELLEAEVLSRTAELGKANTSLEHEIKCHEQAEVELKQKTLSLESEIEERKRMQQEVERTHRELLEISRKAGMSEIATNVLHNVGNVLNSVNVSAALVADRLKKSKVSSLAKVTALFQEHERDLGAFITCDPKGRQLPAYLAKLSKFLMTNQTATIEELDSLQKNVEHIKEIVAMQQNYARISGVEEILNIHSLVEDSLRMNIDALVRHGVKVIRDFEEVPPVIAEKHKILQILINLLRNAKYACADSGRADKRVAIRVASGDGMVRISVMDNGVGIPPENLTRIFNHGFTTRSDGHGFGLHSGALAAKEMGGSLIVFSEGVGKGASFTLELPMQAS